MTFDEFETCCSMDTYDFEDGTTDVTVIFSQGFIKKYSTEFVRSNPEVCKTLVASDIWNYLQKEFGNG